MGYTRLGDTGLQVPELCLGTWMFGTETDEGAVLTDHEEAHEILDAAYEHDLTFLDTANTYGGGDSERFIGDWLEDRDREDVVLASKCYWATRGPHDVGLSRKHVRAEIQDSLDRLGTDYLDIYYIHGWLDEANLEETLSVLNDLVHEGKVHYIGVSNFASWQLLKSQWIADDHDWESVSVIQPRYNALDHYPYTVDPAELPLPDLFDACRDQGIAVCPYAGLAGGFLTGKYERTEDGGIVGPDGSRADVAGDSYGPFTDREWAVLDAVRDVADELDATPGQVAIRWVMDTPDVTSIPIVGARSVDQLEENAGAMDIVLDDDQYDRIRHAGRGEQTGSWPIYVN